MQVQSLGQEDPLEEGTTTHSTIHAWRIPWTEESGGLQSIGLQRVRQTEETQYGCVHTMPFAATWMQLEIITLSEVSQKEKDKYRMVALICGI